MTFFLKIPFRSKIKKYISHSWDLTNFCCDGVSIYSLPKKAPSVSPIVLVNNEQDSGCVSMNEPEVIVINDEVIIATDKTCNNNNEKRNQEQTRSYNDDEGDDHDENDDLLESGSNFLWVGLVNEEPSVQRRDELTLRQDHT